MKRISSLLLAIVMLLSITAGLSISAYAETDENGNPICDDFVYTLLEDGTAEILGHMNGPKDLVIPSELDGYTVTSIGDNAFYNNYYVVNVEIPATITNIGERAFEACENLSSVVIAEGVTEIGYSMFSTCHNLINVEIPNSVTSIGDFAFNKCDNLPIIEIPESVTSIGDYAFSDCDSLTSIVIPDNVTHIGEGAFSYCAALKRIEVSPNNKDYKSVDGVLFNKDMTRLIQYPIGNESETYLIPDAVTCIGMRSFSFDNYLKSIDIPDNVKEIEFDAFFRCENLERATIGKGVTAVGYRLFYGCTNLKEVILSENVPEIEGQMFGECNNLEKIYILNKDCDIQYSYSRTSAIPESATIYGYEGSTAQAYAKKLGIKFVPIEEPTTAETTTETTTQKPTTDATTQKPTTEAATQKPTTEKSTEKPNTEASTADKNDTSKSPSTGIAAKGLFALAAIALAGGAVVFVKKKEQ